MKIVELPKKCIKIRDSHFDYQRFHTQLQDFHILQFFSFHLVKTMRMLHLGKRKKLPCIRADFLNYVVLAMLCRMMNKFEIHLRGGICVEEWHPGIDVNRTATPASITLSHESRLTRRHNRCCRSDRGSLRLHNIVADLHEHLVTSPCNCGMSSVAQ